ncbi:MAG: type II toxin-antitoxin system PemK/MazF family toxin [Candidatus Kapabacteria bacterium]|nr:type II toxin-antitoxin system PemK/MazF family toxin [Candidatus Kapabacteria bacterium]
MVEICRGDIVLVDLNPVIGTEQSGIRPSVIIQNYFFNTYFL